MKVLVVGDNRNYASWIDREIEFLDSTINNIQKADLLIFTGGEDVDPSIYGYNKNSKTHSNPDRDKYEKEFYDKAIALGVRMIGICRGAQYLTALQPNGVLIQHVDGHARSVPHEVTFSDGQTMLATSTHHQMMYPHNVSGASVLAWATTRLSDSYEFDNQTTLDRLPNGRETEVVYYRKSNCLCIQPHPEMMSKTSQFVIKMNSLLEEKLRL